MLKSFVLFLIFQNVATNNFIAIPEKSTIKTSSDAIVAIINRFYYSSSVSINRAEVQNHSRQSDLIDVTLKRLDLVAVNIENLSISQTLDRRVYNLIFIEDMQSFR